MGSSWTPTPGPPLPAPLAGDEQACEVRRRVLGHVPSDGDRGPGPPTHLPEGRQALALGLIFPRVYQPVVGPGGKEGSVATAACPRRRSAERKGTGPTAPSPGCGLPGATHQGVLQLCVRVRYRMPRW